MNIVKDEQMNIGKKKREGGKLFTVENKCRVDGGRWVGEGLNG